MQTVISLQGVEKSYPGGFRLGPLDLHIERGFVVAVVGPNGSGKSTLMQLLMNMTQPDAGKLQLFGSEYPDDEVEIKSKIGYVPDTIEWAQMGRTIANIADYVSYWYPDWDNSKYIELLHKFGLDPKQKIRTLSLGTHRKLALTLAMSHHPELLLLDEPSGGLDPIVWRLMLDEIVGFMKNERRTVVMSTHNMEEVRRLADYICVINRGRLLGYFEKDALLDGWKIIWTDRPAAAADKLPGVVPHVSEGATKLISHSPAETEAALRQEGVGVIRTQAMELDEIFAQLIARHTKANGR